VNTGRINNKCKKSSKLDEIIPIIESESIDEFIGVYRKAVSKRLRRKVIAALDARMDGTDIDTLIENELEDWVPCYANYQ
jgi:hypothetical protein